MSLFLLASVTSLVLTGAAIPALRWAQFIDHPNHRSSHVQPVPRGGGVAVVACLAILAPATLGATVQVVVLVGAMVLLALVGLVDDLRSLSSRVRLLAQAGVAIAAVAVLIAHAGVSWWWLPATAVGVAGYVNAFNFMDGINGISGLTGMTVGLWWAWAGDHEGLTTLATLGLLLAGASVGFLPWNAPRARVFLGDVGSYGLGVYIALLSVVALVESVPLLWVLAPLAVYGADTGTVLIKRALAGRPITEAHREHVYQRLVDGGWRHLSSAVLCAAATALVCVVAALGSGASWPVPTAGVVLLVLAYLASPRVVLGSAA